MWNLFIKTHLIYAQWGVDGDNYSVQYNWFFIISELEIQFYFFNRVMIFRLNRKSIKLITLYVAYLQQNTQKV
jgi:hypothetical protein